VSRLPTEACALFEGCKRDDASNGQSVTNQPVFRLGLFFGGFFGGGLLQGARRFACFVAERVFVLAGIVGRVCLHKPGSPLRVARGTLSPLPSVFVVARLYALRISPRSSGRTMMSARGRTCPLAGAGSARWMQPHRFVSSRFRQGSSVWNHSRLIGFLIPFC